MPALRLLSFSILVCGTVLLPLQTASAKESKPPTSPQHLALTVHDLRPLSAHYSVAGQYVADLSVLGPRNLNVERDGCYRGYLRVFNTVRDTASGLSLITQVISCLKNGGARSALVDMNHGELKTHGIEDHLRTVQAPDIGSGSRELVGKRAVKGSSKVYVYIVEFRVGRYLGLIYDDQGRSAEAAKAIKAARLQAHRLAKGN